MYKATKLHEIIPRVRRCCRSLGVQGWEVCPRWNILRCDRKRLGMHQVDEVPGCWSL